MTFHEKVIKKAFFAPVKHIFTPSPCTPVKKRFCYSFSLLKYRYEISIVDISTLLKNIDIDIDIDMEKLKISISISIRQFCKISISIKYRIDSNLAYRTGLFLARESVQILSPAVPPPPVTREKIRWLN